MWEGGERERVRQSETKREREGELVQLAKQLYNHQET